MSDTRQQPGPHVLIICHDVIGSRMAGPGIRYWEMARVLAAQQPVTLIAPQPIAFDDDGDNPSVPTLTCGSYTWGDAASLAGWLETADVVVANGFVLRAHPELAALDQPLALDLYDPVLLENLELFRGASAEQRREQWEHDSSLLQHQLAIGDFFMCATERQRDLYIGALLQAGRVTPALADADPLLRALIDVVPFGLPAEPPHKQQPVLRGVIPGISPDDVLLLWTGGLWDWLDPLTLIRAMPIVAESQPQTRLVFLAGAHPGAAHPMCVPQEARNLADSLGLLNTHIFFYEQWVPYQQRADFLLEADIAVSLHRNHLETAYAAVRSRFLDHMWAGLPSIVSAGDAAAELVRTCNLGYTVAPEDVDTLATTICRLVADTQQRELFAAHARRVAQDFSWTRTLTPLTRFCHTPGISASRNRTAPTHAAEEVTVPQLSPGDRADMQQDKQQLVQQIEDSWQFGSAGGQGNIIGRLARRMLQRVLGPLIEQQRTFNASSVKLFYNVLAQQEETASTLNASLNAVMAQIATMQHTLHVHRDTLRAHRDTLRAQQDTLRAQQELLQTHQRDLHARLDTISTFTGDLSQRIDTLHHDLHARLDEISTFTGDLSQRIDTLHRDLHGRLDTFATFNGTINDRLSRLTYTVQLLDDAVAAADEASADLAGHLVLLQPPASGPDHDIHKTHGSSGTSATAGTPGQRESRRSRKS